jgi:hypothetical protein
LKNAHVSYVGKYIFDEVFKDVFERLIHGLQVKNILVAGQTILPFG